MISLILDGAPVELGIDPQTPLLWALRHHLGLTGTKYGCGVGICGICTVLVDDRAERACVLPLQAVSGRRVTTIEGLAHGGSHPLVQAWIAAQVPQCGYCQPGQLLAAAALLHRHPDPSDEQIDDALSGVLCRCGSYQRIRRAIHAAAASHCPDAESAQRPPPAQIEREQPPADAAAFAPNPWIRISRDGAVTVLIDRSEMGQGVVTGLAMLVAEELEVDLEQIYTAFAPADPVYRNAIIGTQTTGGSTSIRAAWEPLRQAAADTRARLIAAAARRWGVPGGTCRAEHGSVFHTASGRHLSYGELVRTATPLPAGAPAAVKSPDQFRILGQSLPRLEIPDMVTGRTMYASDLRRPGMLAAAVARAPTIGGRFQGANRRAAEQQPGVRHVVAIDSGVAVVADDFPAALRGRDALDAQWDTGPHGDLSSETIRTALQQATHRRGAAARSSGDAYGALKHGPVVEARYDTPYLAHATMEPMSCVANVDGERCEVWIGTQDQEAAAETAARLTGLPPQNVHIHSMFLGGGFGRRLETDCMAEAVQISKAIGAPVQLLWTRGDDLQHDFYRPANCTWLRATLDEHGLPRAWLQRLAGPPLSLMGVDVPYAIGNLREEHVTIDPGVPTGSWRSVGASQNAFGVESFIDELAHAAGRDPLDYRLQLLTEAPRHRAVLEWAAAEAGWGTPPPANRHRGLAVYHSFGSWVAQVAEVSVQPTTGIRVHRMVCAIDCGIAINPNEIVAQLEGAVAFGLSAALKEEIIVHNGRVTQATFDDYPILTMAEMPVVEVHIVPSREPPGGVGEPGVPPVAPAVANAVFAATGQRLRSLPLRLEPPIEFSHVR